MAKKKSAKKKSKSKDSKSKKKKSAKKSKKKSSKSKGPTKVKNKNKDKPTEVRYHSTKEIKVEKALLDNFIGLQKVMVNLSSKFDKLSDEISKLLNLFEVSAKAMAKKEFQTEKDPAIKKIHDKLDNLSKQAGLIGKGLALIHEANMEGQGHENPNMKRFEPQPSKIPRPQPKFQPAQGKHMEIGPQKKSNSGAPSPGIGPEMPQPPMPSQSQNVPGQSPSPGSMQRQQNQQGGQQDQGTQTKEIGAEGNMQPSIMPSKSEMAQKNLNQSKTQGTEQNPQQNPQAQQGQQTQNQNQNQGQQTQVGQGQQNAQ